MVSPKARIVFFSHGGGPLPILGDASHQAMIDFMTALPAQLPRPEAIVVISAHWEESSATLLGAKQPPMFYDYYGFPPEAYALQYPAPGAPALAARLAALIESAGIPAAINDQRGYDHGHFIPLKMLYPDANIPTTQLSLLRGLDPARHLALGAALRPLLAENLLIIGSGFSFHNMEAFLWGRSAYTAALNNAFQDWLIETVAGTLPAAEIEKRLVAWAQAPNARYCHPREEHLLPLHVCQGLALSPAKVIFDAEIFGLRSLGFLWS